MDSAKELLTNEMSKYEYIIFDFDKTICELMVDWVKLKKQLSNFIMNRHGDSIIFTPLNHTLKEVQLKYGQIELIKLYKIIESFELQGGYCNINNTIINHISQKKKHFAIYSMNMRGTIYTFLEDLKILKYFDIIIGKDNCASYKPSGNDIDFIINKWNIEKCKVLFIGDSQDDLLSGEIAMINTFIL